MASVYKKHTHREHILELPDTYIGSVETIDDTRWVFNNESHKMEFKNVRFNPGLYKIFDEVLVNARDAMVRSGNVKHIDVTCGMVKDIYTISVKNDGDGIPIEIHKETGIYAPELIFGHLLTSGNYDKEEEKIVGGKNGYGAKLANIFSTRFEVETRSITTGKLYSQIWKENMSKCGKPSIEVSNAKDVAKGFVKVTYSPDVNRFLGAFDGPTLIDDMFSVFQTRVFEIAAMAGKDVKVSFNKEEVKTNTFEKFVKLFISDEKHIAYEKSSDRWEVAVILTRNLFDSDATLPDEKQISFVNGINTKKGGKHVETVFKTLMGDFCELAKKKKIDVKPSQLKDSVLLFVNATIVNPSFDSQTKETLTTPASKFGSQFKPSSKIIDSLVKIGLLEEAQNILEAKASKDAKKTDGTKKKTLRGMPKLVDALHAGTSKSSDCTLILTEGDSAASSAIAGLKVVGRELWGVFPLKGKMLNVRDISQDKFSKNEELTAIKKILGLEQKKKYNDVKTLRYGRIMIMADQDLDGSHIKGLVMNLFHAEWPQLIKNGFICSLATPLLKATKKNSTISFYTIQEFEAWKAKQSDMKGWYMKYYKGLGTSTPEEAQEWFVDLHEVKYEFDDNTDDNFSLAFNKKRSDDRKVWLNTYDPKRILTPKNGKVDYSNFIHDELIHFSNADNIRSLPVIMDGLKPSQRKILFACLKRGLRSEIKVAQLAGYVSEHAAYHHGEASLQGAIVNLAQTFVGANNINILAPVGQFGCLAPDTPVLMWDGIIKRADSVIIGDKLIGDDGNERSVLNITEGIDMMYNIITENNKTYTVNSQHIISLFFNDNNMIKWKESGTRWYLNYFDGKDIKSINVTVNITDTKYNHFNKSTLTIEEGYKLILEKQKEIQKQYNCETTIDIKIEDYIKLSSYAKRNLFMISNTKSINWEKKPVMINPYILGVWLGDGNHDGNGFTSADEEILKEIAIWADTINCEMVHHANGYEHENYHYGLRRKNSGYRVSIGDTEHSSEICTGCLTSQKKSPICNLLFNKTPSEIQPSTTIHGHIRNDMNPFKNLLKENNLFKNKHIPKDYLINDKYTRLELLAGLIDTDGCVKHVTDTQYYIEITQSKRLHERLLNDIDYLANSLGFATSRTDIYVGKTNKNEDIITISLRIFGENLYEIPTRLPRKQMLNTNESRKKKYYNYTSFKINEIGKGAFYGWSIDKNERFLLGNFIVTHNSRLQGGKDSASPRYIHTHLESIVDKIYRKEDSCILKHINDDGLIVEPENYYPVVPMLIINGSEGIGTGFSTDIPPHDPDDVVMLLKDRLKGKRNSLENLALRPYWFGFKGPVQMVENGVWITKGLYVFNDAKKIVTVTELPVGSWTTDYKEFLEELCSIPDKESKKPILKNYEDLYNHIDIRFDLYLEPDYYDDAKDNVHEFEKRFKLTSTWRTSNMVAFTTDFKIKRYECVGNIMEEFYVERLAKYEERRLKEIESLKRDAQEADAKARFLRGVLNDTIDLRRKTDDEIVLIMKKHDLPAMSNMVEPDNVDSYDYLLRLRIDRVKASAIEDAEKAVMKALELLKQLEGTSASQIWMRELDEFEVAWKYMKNERTKLLENDIKMKSKKTKK